MHKCIRETLICAFGAIELRMHLVQSCRLSAAIPLSLGQPDGILVNYQVAETHGRGNTFSWKMRKSSGRKFVVLGQSFYWVAKMEYNWMIWFIFMAIFSVLDSIVIRSV